MDTRISTTQHFKPASVTQKQADGKHQANVDFLASVAGLATVDVVRRAVEMEVPQIGRLRVMHPIDVLDSRVQNLDLIPSKRTPAGVSQAKLAIDVARASVAAEIVERGEKKALRLLERIAAIAADDGATRVFLRYGIDPLASRATRGFQNDDRASYQALAADRRRAGTKAQQAPSTAITASKIRRLQGTRDRPGNLDRVESPPVVQATFGPRQGLNPPAFDYNLPSFCPLRGHRAHRKEGVTWLKPSPLVPISIGFARPPSSRFVNCSAGPDARLADAQLAIAREYGFSSWRALKAHVDAIDELRRHVLR